jgi:protein-tyrosine phosphatase
VRQLTKCRRRQVRATVGSVEAEEGDRKLGTTRRLVWDGCFNVRDLGGLPLRGGGVTASGVVFRADDLARLTAEGRRQFDALEVAGVLDLRSRWEVERWPSPLSGRSFYENTPLWNETMDAVATGLAVTEVYKMMTVWLRPELKRIFERMAMGTRRGTVVVHCFSGKDRTGLTSALLLDCCGVERAAIAEDYGLSGVWLRDMFDGWIAAADPAERVGLAQQLATDPETILSMLEFLDAEFGGVAEFLTNCGLPSNDLAQLCARLAP